MINCSIVPKQHVTMFFGAQLARLSYTVGPLVFLVVPMRHFWNRESSNVSGWQTLLEMIPPKQFKSRTQGSRGWFHIFLPIYSKWDWKWIFAQPFNRRSSSFLLTKHVGVRACTMRLWAKTRIFWCHILGKVSKCSLSNLTPPLTNPVLGTPRKKNINHWKSMVGRYDFLLK